nr:MAG TPA: tail collar domain protein [Caudoviricetes sp.]
MAVNYTIKMKQYTGVDYNQMYPKVNSGDILLDKTTREKFDLAQYSTYNDVLVKITKKGYTFQIGDVLVTARTDMNSNWLLCNGDSLSSTEYPELSALLVASLGVSRLPVYSPSDKLYAYIRAK